MEIELFTPRRDGPETRRRKRKIEKRREKERRLISNGRQMRRKSDRESMIGYEWMDGWMDEVGMQSPKRSTKKMTAFWSVVYQPKKARFSLSSVR